MGERMPGNDTSLGGERRGLPPTVGGLVERVARGSPERRQEAFQELCETYWKPVYRCLRVGWAKSNEDAKDLTQAFFLWLYERNSLERYDRARGSFRAFLKTLLKHFVQHHEEALGRIKRGGHLTFVRVDDQAERLADPRETDPDAAFDAHWRRGLLERAVAAVRARCAATGREIRFRVFEAYDMTPPERRPSYEALAERLGLRAGDVHNHLVRVREEIREEIRAELARTTDGPEALEEEWREFRAGS